MRRTINLSLSNSRTFFNPSMNSFSGAWRGRKVTYPHLVNRPFFMQNFFQPSTIKYYSSQPSVIKSTYGEDNIMELANYFTKNLHMPKKALQIVFLSEIAEFEKEKGVFDNYFKNKLWASISEKRIEMLRESISEKYADTILCKFKTPILKIMHKQLQENNEIPYKWEEIWHYQITLLKPIEEALSLKAETMRDEIKNEIYQSQYQRNSKETQLPVKKT